MIIELVLANYNFFLEFFMKKAELILVAFVVILAFTRCSKDDGNSTHYWLADLDNPFIGEWEALIPSMGNARSVFEFKADGTFTCVFPDLPEEYGGGVIYTGGYLVKGNVQVTFLSWDGGIGGYTFQVVDNDTINVTEIDEVNEDGSFELGNTAPFTRLSGSQVNKETEPFVLNNNLIGGTWGESHTPYKAKYHFNVNGTGTMEFAEEAQITFDIAYSVFHDDGIDNEILVVFMSGPNTFTAYSFVGEGQDTIAVQEIAGIEMEQSGPAATYRDSITFTRSQ